MLVLLHINRYFFKSASYAYLAWNYCRVPGLDFTLKRRD
jgi:hypothetical protein